MRRKGYKSRRMLTAVRIPWELLVDLELEAQRLDVSRSQLISEYVAAGLGAPLPAPVRARNRPRKRRTRNLPIDIRETSAPWLREPTGAVVEECVVDLDENHRRPLVEAPVAPEDWGDRPDLEPLPGRMKPRSGWWTRLGPDRKRPKGRGQDD